MLLMCSKQCDGLRVNVDNVLQPGSWAQGWERGTMLTRLLPSFLSGLSTL